MEEIKFKPGPQQGMKVVWDLEVSMDAQTRAFLENSLIPQYGNGPFTVTKVNSTPGHSDVELIGPDGTPVDERLDWHYLRPE